MLDKALSAVEKYNMLSPGTAVIAAVSGGADSMAMLLFLMKISERNMCAPSAKRTLFALKSFTPMLQPLQNRAGRPAKSAGEECAMSFLNR